MNRALKISLALSLVGILVLIFLSSHLEPKSLPISNITEEYLNQEVKITGQITKIKDFKDINFQILEFQDLTGSIDVTTNSENLTINKNLTYVIIGKVSDYNGTIQINADKIQEVKT